MIDLVQPKVHKMDLMGGEKKRVEVGVLCGVVMVVLICVVVVAAAAAGGQLSLTGGAGGQGVDRGVGQVGRGGTDCSVEAGVGQHVSRHVQPRVEVGQVTVT